MTHSVAPRRRCPFSSAFLPKQCLPFLPTSARSVSILRSVIYGLLGPAILSAPTGAFARALRDERASGEHYKQKG